MKAIKRMRIFSIGFSGMPSRVTGFPIRCSLRARKKRANECFAAAGTYSRRGQIMLVVMQSQATSEQIERVLDAIRQIKLTPHPMPGATRTAIGITGNIGAIDPRTLEVLPGVSELLRVT